ncbi:10441_t:CDS:1, partial [Acaulospora colombiana]
MAFKSSQLFMFLVVVVFLLSFNIDSYHSAPVSSRQTPTFSGDGTWYNPGLGACGETSSDTDIICALSFTQYQASADGNPNHSPSCGRKIQAFYNGNSVIATVVDECMGCDE